MPRELAIAWPAPSAPSLLSVASPSWLNAALVKVAAASAVLAPFALGARLVGGARRARLEADRAASALAQLGIRERPLAVERLGAGGRSNAVYKLRFADRTLVLKQGLAEGTILAFGARWVGPQGFGDVTAVARIGREARALEALHTAGVRVPRVVAANVGAALLLVEHVPGEPLPATLHRPGAAARIRAYAAAIRAAHAAGVTLGDAHPGNALVGPDGTITLIDLEFAELGAVSLSARAFDLAYASHYFTDDERRVFLAAVITDDTTAAAVRAASERLDDFGVLFALERRRQRATDPDDPTTPGAATAARPWQPLVRMSEPTALAVPELDERRAA